MRKKTMDDMDALAEERNGKFLSTKYLGAHEKHQWQCRCGNVWEATPSGIKGGRWCPKCGGSKKKTIDDMHPLAKSKGGKCLSTEYENNRKKLKWQCRDGHVWWAKFAHVQQGHWCPKCAGNKKKTIEDMHALAEERNGKLLSPQCLGVDEKHKWQCSKEHVWEAIPSSVQRGSWCPECAGSKKKTIEDMDVLAELRGGKCLSTECKNTKTPLKWQCRCGNVWEAIPSSVQRGSWCPKCATKAKADKKRGNIGDMEILAKAKGGKCLSTEYKNNSTHLKWQCIEEHIFEARPCDIQQGRWCRICNKQKRKHGTTFRLDKKGSPVLQQKIAFDGKVSPTL